MTPPLKPEDWAARHVRAALGFVAIIASIALFALNHGHLNSREELLMHALLIGAGYLLIDKDSFKEIISTIGDKLAFWKR